ncbi:MAG: type II secretion system protein [Candidatus Absconditabacteria bacterium]
MRRKLFTLIELVIYMGLSSVIGVFLFTFASQFFQTLKRTEDLGQFSNNYNSLIKKIYSDSYNGRNFYEQSLTGVIFENNGTVAQLSGYRALSCLDWGVGLTRIEAFTGDIDWEKFDMTFTGFDCKMLKGYSVTEGAWLELSIGVVGRDLDFKYFISN